MKILLFIFSILGLVLSSVVTAQATTFIGQTPHETEVTVNEPHDDLYIFNQRVTVNAKTTGDLAVLGGSVLLNGEVENSIFVAGGNVTIRSNTHRHIRVLGGTVVISGNVGGDVFVGGGEVVLDSKGTIGGGLYVAGGQINIKGTVIGPTFLAGDAATISGNISDLTVYSDSLLITSSAVITGPVKYRGNRQATVEAGAELTHAIDYQALRLGREMSLAEVIFSLISMILVTVGSILITYVYGRLLFSTQNRVAEKFTSRTLASLGVGLLVIFLGPIVAVLLLLSQFGSPFGLLGLALWLPLILISSMALSLIAGNWVLGLINRQRPVSLLLAATAGVLIFRLLWLVPVVGQLAVVVALTIAVGSVVLTLSERLKWSDN